MYEDKAGKHQFTAGRFNKRGKIYRGCTALDATTYTLQRLAALGGDMLPAEPNPGSATASVAIEPADRSNYSSENGSRVVVPIKSPYPLTCEPGSRYGATRKYWLIVDVPPYARSAASSTSRHFNGTAAATIDWQVVDPTPSPGTSPLDRQEIG